MFAGRCYEYVDDWLDTYERYSAYNRWDDTLKFLNVSFYLIEVARNWFINREPHTTNWSTFKQQFRQYFADQAVRTEVAKTKLASLFQGPDESYASYMEDVIALCRCFSPTMPETDRVHHVLK
ncbi:hypothetical protein V5799_009985 [Amblyomma americanum]|uniref:Retrotransposon gag domain-containing protein n=1 Tax=Amblyomma americanum TaxID=6943 RepID=A0AAQ4F8V6_AMBAM